MNGLKRLSGAKDVEPDAPVQSGKGSWIVHFEGQPKVALKAISEAVGKYKVEAVKAKITSKVVEKDKGFMAGDIALANGKEKDAPDVLKEVAAFVKEKKDTLVLRGVLTEDDKGKQTLVLTRVDEKK